MDGEHLITEPLNDSTGFYIRATRKVGEWQTGLQKLEIYETPQYGRMLRLGGWNLTSEREEFVYHENLVHPALTAQLGPRKVLILGGSDGGSCEEALKHPSIEQVTVCEADEEVIRIAREHLPAVHRDVFADPRLRVVARDGASFLRETPDRYDLIIADLNAGPAEALFSVEFLGQCRTALVQGGALVLQLGAPMARPGRVAEIAQRLNGIFRIVRPYTVYVPLFGTQWAMAVCSDKL
jgi:spermidine synthase